MFVPLPICQRAAERLVPRRSGALLALRQAVAHGSEDCGRGARFAGLAWAIGLVLVAAGGTLRAEDWPTYQHDAARSGITSEKVPVPLVESWVFQPAQPPEPAWGPPKAEPVEDVLELRRIHFDDASQVAAAGGRVYFGSSADGKVYCLDAATGRVLWTKMTGGPVRLAPTVWEGRVYVGSDDGRAYCLDGTSGAVDWQFRAAPDPRRVLGSRRMISLWPLRSGVLVDAGVAYLAAGIFPAEGVFFYALDAKDGSLRWRNDGAGEAPQSQVSPQGYLLASATTLYAPMGRVSPAAFDRSDGKLKFLTFFGKNVGGTYALLADGEELYTGTEELTAFRSSPKDRFATYPGRKLIVSRDTVYLAGDTHLSSLDRKAYPAAGSKVRSLRARLQQLQAAQKEKGKSPPPDAAEIQKAAAQLNAAREELVRTIRWEVPCALNEALILAGDVLLAGGAGRVRAIDVRSGKTLWEGKVEGNAKGLAAADGRLLVSTDTGKIYCFAAEGAPRHGAVAQPAVADPYKDSPLAASIRQAARSILDQTGIRRGYCLVLDCRTGQLALELARQSELMIYATSPNADSVAAARKALDAAGVYGTRVYVEQWPADKLPCADYFANLVVSEGAVAGGDLPAAPAELFRVLKPLGGTAFVGQPAGGSGGRTLDAAAVGRWLAAAKLPGAEVVSRDGAWAKIVRGPIAGAGSWTHQYGEPGNTGCGDDRALKGPLEVLWFGDPGPGSMVNRHLRAVAPLAIEGRMFVQGENVLMAYDAYNGLRLWQREMPGAIRTNASSDSSNLAANRGALFVAVEGQCLRLEPATGKTAKTYDLPPAADGKPRRWGYLAATEKLLYGSGSPAVANLARNPWAAVTTSNTLFALDIASGKLAWSYQGQRIPHNAIAIADGKVLLADLGTPAKPDEWRVVAMDAQTGRIAWQKTVEFPLSRGGAMAVIAHRGVLLLFGVYTDGHYWKEFFAGQFADRRITALATEDGKLLWSKPLGYRVRPVVIGDTLHAEPWTYDLRTGEAKTRIHPVTGRPDRWQFARPGHHCGCPIGSPNCLIFRSWCLGYYDLVADAGTMHFGGQRPGCWVNAVPAAGLLLVPEASVGCMCAFPNMCSVALKPAQSNRGYAYYSAPGPLTPVKRLGIAFGAAGDRKDGAGNLWLGYPRPKGSLVLPVDLSVALLPGGTYLQGSSHFPQVTGVEDAWLFSSAVVGLSRCAVPLLGPGDPPATYRVRLAFADPDNSAPGQRVFDVKLQGQVVLKDFDVVKEAGGRNRAALKQFSGIRVQDRLMIELAPKTDKPTPEQGPILQAVEIVRM